MDKADSTSDDTFLAKLNGAGSLEWWKSYGIPDSNFRAKDFALTPDGGFFFSLEVSTETDGVQLVKLDTYGNIVSQMNYTASHYEGVEDVDVDKDGNFVILGNFYLPPDSGGCYITKISPSFEMLARKAFSHENYLSCYNIKAQDDGSYFVGADAQRSSDYHFHPLLIKLEQDLTACGSLVDESLPSIVLNQGLAS